MSIAGSCYTVQPGLPKIHFLQGSVLIIGGEYTDTLPTVEVITNDLQVLSKFVPDAPDRNVYWTAQKVGMSLPLVLFCVFSCSKVFSCGLSMS